MSKVLRAIGLMSGTSLDGIDIALVETDGEDRVRRGPATTVDYRPGFRRRLQQCLFEALHMTERTERPGILAGLHHQRHGGRISMFDVQRSSHLPIPRMRACMSSMAGASFIFSSVLAFFK